MLTFLNPGYLYALPLVCLPLILHLLVRKSLVQVILPSVFFLEKIQSSMRKRFMLSRIAEMLLEMCFIALIILAFANPVPPKKSLSFTRLCAFIDNSPSQFTSESRFTADFITQWFNTHYAQKELYVFDIRSVAEGIPPLRIESPNHLNSYLADIPQFNGSFLFKDLFSYFQSHSEFLFEAQSLTLISSDFADNHFTDTASWDGPRLAVFQQPAGPKVTVHIPDPGGRLVFSGDRPEIQLLFTKGAPGGTLSNTYSLRISFLQNAHPSSSSSSSSSAAAAAAPSSSSSAFLSAENYDKNDFKVIYQKNTYTDETRVTALLNALRPGLNIFKAEMLTSNGTLMDREYFTLSAIPRFSLHIYTGKSEAASEIMELFSAVFQYDIQADNIRLSGDPEGADVIIAAGFNTSAEIDFLKNKKALLFMPSGYDRRLWDSMFSMLGSELSVFREIRHRAGLPLTLAKSTVFSGYFSIFSQFLLWKDLTFSSYYQIQGFIPSDTVFFFTDGTPMLLREKNRFIFNFDPDPEKNNFLTSSVCVPVIMQTIAALFSFPGGTEHTSQEQMPAPPAIYFADTFPGHSGQSRWYVQDTDIRQIINTGVKLDSGIITVINRSLNELTSKPSPQIKKFFNNPFFLTTEDTIAESDDILNYPVAAALIIFLILFINTVVPGKFHQKKK